MVTVKLDGNYVTIVDGDRDIPTLFTPQILKDLRTSKQLDAGEITAVGDTSRIRLYYPDEHEHSHIRSTSVGRTVLATWVAQKQPVTENVSGPKPETEPE